MILMRRLVFLLPLFLLSCSNEDKYVWYNGTVDEAIESLKNKPETHVMLDFYSDG